MSSPISSKKITYLCSWHLSDEDRSPIPPVLVPASRDKITRRDRKWGPIEGAILSTEIFGILGFGILSTKIFGIFRILGVGILSTEKIFGILGVGILSTKIFGIFRILGVGILSTEKIFGILGVGILNTEKIFGILGVEILSTEIFGILGVGILSTEIFVILWAGSSAQRSSGSLGSGSHKDLRDPRSRDPQHRDIRDPWGLNPQNRDLRDPWGGILRTKIFWYSQHKDLRDPPGSGSLGSGFLRRSSSPVQGSLRLGSLGIEIFWVPRLPGKVILRTETFGDPQHKKSSGFIEIGILRKKNVPLSSGTNHVKHFKSLLREGFVLFLKNKANNYINMTYLVYFLSTFIIFLAFSWGCVTTLFLYLCLSICWYWVSFDMYLDACTRTGIILVLYYSAYLECQSVCPFVWIGSPPSPLQQASVSPTGTQWGGGGAGDHIRLRVRGSVGANSGDWIESLALCIICACTLSVYVHVVCPDICLLISCHSPACMEGSTLIGIFGIWIHISICISCCTNAYIWWASIWNY